MTSARHGLVALIALTALSARGSAQQPDPLPAADGAQTYLFRSLLEFQDVKPITRLPSNSSKVILVLFGRLGKNEQLNHSSVLAKTVLNAGGAVLIATDQNTDLRDYFPLVNEVRVSALPGLVRQPTNDNCLGVRPEMPFLIPKPLSIPQPNLLAMSQYKRVATNYPGVLLGFPQVGFTPVPLATLPPHTILGDDRMLFATMNDPATAARGETAVIYADAGMFSNRMLAAAGADNLAYTFHLTKFLVDGSSGRRNRCLFVEDGVVRTDFDRVPLAGMTPPTPPLPVPSLEQVEKKLNDIADTAADKFESSNVLEQWASRKYRSIAEVIAVILAVIAVLAVWRRFWSGKHSPDQTPIPAAAEPTTNILDRRRQEMLRANDVTEPAREYLRERFLAWGLPAEATNLPQVVTTGVSRNGRAVTEALRKLWEVAAGEVPDRVTFVRWKELEVMIETVDRAADAGRWRFAAGVDA